MKTLFADRRILLLLLVGCVLAIVEGWWRQPHRLELEDPRLVATLMPPGASGGELVQASDEPCAFVARGVPFSLTARKYYEFLRKQGVEIVVGGSGSSHNPLSVVDSYHVSVSVIASRDPLTIATKTIDDYDPRDEPGLIRSMLGMGYSAPVQKWGRTLTFRLGKYCAQSWKMHVLLPKTDLKPLPFDLPRPLSAVVRDATLRCTEMGSVAEVPQSLGAWCTLTVQLVTAASANDVVAEWMKQTNGLGVQSAGRSQESQWGLVKVDPDTALGVRGVTTLSLRVASAWPAGDSRASELGEALRPYRTIELSLRNDRRPAT